MNILYSIKDIYIQILQSTHLGHIIIKLFFHLSPIIQPDTLIYNMTQ